MWNDPLRSLNYKIFYIGMNITFLLFFTSSIGAVPLAWLSFAFKKYTMAYRIITLPFSPLIMIITFLTLGLAYYAGGPNFMQFSM